MIVVAIIVGLSVLVGAAIIGYVYWQTSTEFPKPGIIQDSHLPSPDALLVDPNNPPTLKVYRPKGDSVVNCTCHGRPLQPEDEIMWWPMPDSGGVVHVYCPQTLIEASRGAR